MKYTKNVEKWGIFEATLEGRTEGNPFTDYDIHGVFTNRNETKTVDGFYDGEGIYKVRFMPSFEGEYSFEICGSFSDEKYSGSFTALPAGENNHGIVRVANTYHFAYEDGTPYYPVGTTCYVWTHQTEELQQQTLSELSKGYFNKIRFCVFPKHYDFNFRDPVSFPYEGTPCDGSMITRENFMQYKPENEGNDWDFFRFNTLHFRNFEKRIGELRDMGIEADIIVFHPYDRWGFSNMGREADDLYVKYIVARFSAYRNVWWSLANEYDLVYSKNLADWERIAGIICEKDVYSHLRSIHNAGSIYDFKRPWVTHCCIQAAQTERVREWREAYRKPVIVDELNYEGNIEHDFGNLTGEECVRRFWEATLRGGYGGHGETFYNDENILWWSHGGKLYGEAPERLKFMHGILNETPCHGLAPSRNEWRTALSGKDHRILYLGKTRPVYKFIHYDDVNDYRVELIDTWNMTVEDMGIYRGRFKIELPGREYMALRIQKV